MEVLTYFALSTDPLVFYAKILKNKKTKTRVWHFSFLSSMHEQHHCVSHGTLKSSYTWLENHLLVLAAFNVKIHFIYLNQIVAST